MEITEETVIKQYCFKRFIGKGCFGRVWEAYDTQEKQKVAIKMVNKEVFIDMPKFEEYLRNEINYLSDIKHENIIKFLDFFEDNIFMYFVTEYCDGDLGAYLQEKMRIPEKEALGFLKQIISAFQVLNANKIMHRDLKLENILYRKNGKNEKILKLADFDFAKKGEIATTYLGTKYYMAPEILKTSTAYYTNKADLWSLGVVFYKLLYGNYPFKGKTEGNLISNIESLNVNYHEEFGISEFSVNLMKEIFQAEPEKRISWEKLYEYFDLPPVTISRIREKQLKEEEEEKKRNELTKDQPIRNHYGQGSMKKEFPQNDEIVLPKHKKNEEVEESHTFCFWFKKKFF